MTGSIIVINVDIRETRVALVEGGVIAELQIERASHRGTVGNVVLGKVTRVLPGMQAAFIDVGQERSAFLHVEDLIRPDDFELYLAGGSDEGGESFRGTGERKATAVREEDEEDDEDEGSGDGRPSAAAESAAAPVASLSIGPPGVASDAAELEDEDDEDDEDDEEVDPEGIDAVESADGSDGDADDTDDVEDLEDIEDLDEDEEDEGVEAPVSVALSVPVSVPLSVPLSAAVVGSDVVGSDVVASDVVASDDEAASLGLPSYTVSSVVEGAPIAAAAAIALASSRASSAVGRDAPASRALRSDKAPGRFDEGPQSDGGRRGNRRGRGANARGRRGRNRGNTNTNANGAGNSNANTNSNSRAESSKLVRGRRPPVRGKSGQRGAEASMPPRVTRSVPITEVVHEGDQVVVQISKEPIGTKGARVTSHVSLPGRYVVYLPTVDHLGISKRIGSARERSRLRQVMESLKPARGGLIVRTVAEGLTKKQLKADVGYLIRVWAEVCKRRETAKPAEVLYTELDLVLKVARDLFTDEVKTIVIDDRDQYARLVRFVEMFLPERVKDIELYAGSEPIFDAYGIEDEIGRALSRKVPLPSGGSLIVDQAEALTAIDVNTGRYVGKGSKDLEETALKTNLEAVEEIAYQLRFRNIGGLVILDLIDMEKYQNREKVWRALETALVKDKAKTTLNRISELGLIEMTRKRTRESLGRMLHEPCFYCDGTGQIQSKATIAYEILRQIGRERYSLPGYSVVVNAHPAIVDFLKTVDRSALDEAERRYARRIELAQRTEYHIEQYDLQGK